MIHLWAFFSLYLSLGLRWGSSLAAENSWDKGKQTNVKLANEKVNQT